MKCTAMVGKFDRFRLDCSLVSLYRFSLYQSDCGCYTLVYTCIKLLYSIPYSRDINFFLLCTAEN